MICFYLSMISSCGWPLMDDVLVLSLVKCGKHQHIDVRDWKKKSKEIVSHLNTHNYVEYCYSSFLIINPSIRKFSHIYTGQLIIRFISINFCCRCKLYLFTNLAWVCHMLNKSGMRHNLWRTACGRLGHV